MSTKFAQIFDQETRRRNAIISKEPQRYSKMAEKIAELLAKDYELNRARYKNCNYGNAEILDCSAFQNYQDCYRVYGKLYYFINLNVDKLLDLVRSKLNEWNYEVTGLSAYNDHTHGGNEKFFLRFHVEFQS